MAGARLKSPKTKGNNSLSNRRDWSVPNWDNPSKKEMRKFEKATGYPQFLGGFREGHIEDMYKDQRIDWYANDDSYDATFQGLADETGLNFQRVMHQDDAEIVNFNEKGAEFFLERTDKDLTNNDPTVMPFKSSDHQIAFGPLENEKRKAAGQPELEYAGALGISNAWDNKQHGNTPGLEHFKSHDDMYQTNRSIDLTGADVKRFKYMPGIKGGESGAKTGNWDLQAAQHNEHTRQHEVGHSMGIAGDLTLGDKDPSAMSYNFNIREGKLGKREYESIKNNFKPYQTGGEAAPYVPSAPLAPSAYNLNESVAPKRSGKKGGKKPKKREEQVSPLRTERRKKARKRAQRRRKNKSKR